jgi:hypothetical protein
MPAAESKRRPVQRIEMFGEDFFERSSRLLRSFQVEAHCLLDTEMPQIHRFDLFVIGSGAGGSGAAYRCRRAGL